MRQLLKLKHMVWKQTKTKILIAIEIELWTLPFVGRASNNYIFISIWRIVLQLRQWQQIGFRDRIRNNWSWSHQAEECQTNKEHKMVLAAKLWGQDRSPTCSFLPIKCKRNNMKMWIVHRELRNIDDSKKYKLINMGRRKRGCRVCSWV